MYQKLSILQNAKWLPKAVFSKDQVDYCSRLRQKQCKRNETISKNQYQMPKYVSKNS